MNHKELKLIKIKNKVILTIKIIVYGRFNKSEYNCQLGTYF